MDRIGLSEANFEDKVFYDKNKSLSNTVILILKSENLIKESLRGRNLTPKYNQNILNLILPRYFSRQRSSPCINIQNI